MLFLLPAAGWMATRCQRWERELGKPGAAGSSIAIWLELGAVVGHRLLAERHVLSRQRIQRRYQGVVGGAEATMGDGAGEFHLLALSLRPLARHLL
jgi:hypothetical protein